MIDERWFKYHKPNYRTIPLYEQIRTAERECYLAINGVVTKRRIGGGRPQTEQFDKINAACRAFAEAIDRLAPECADKTAAIRCVRHAKMLANEAIANWPVDTGAGASWAAAIRDARLWANAAIAIGDAEQNPEPS